MPEVEQSAGVGEHGVVASVAAQRPGRAAGRVAAPAVGRRRRGPGAARRSPPRPGGPRRRRPPRRPGRGTPRPRPARRRRRSCRRRSARPRRPPRRSPRSAGRSARPSASTCSATAYTSPSTQPPDSDPTTLPSGPTSIDAPGCRGADDQVADDGGQGAGLPGPPPREQRGQDVPRRRHRTSCRAHAPSLPGRARPRHEPRWADVISTLDGSRGRCATLSRASASSSVEISSGSSSSAPVARSPHSTAAHVVGVEVGARARVAREGRPAGERRGRRPRGPGGPGVRRTWPGPGSFRDLPPCSRTLRTTSAPTSGRSTRWTRAASGRRPPRSPAASDALIPGPSRGQRTTSTSLVAGPAGLGEQGGDLVTGGADDHQDPVAAAVEQHLRGPPHPRLPGTVPPQTLRPPGPAPGAGGEQDAVDAWASRRRRAPAAAGRGPRRAAARWSRTRPRRAARDGRRGR